MIERTRDVAAWIESHRGTESGQALARFAVTDRLMEAQEDACAEIEDRGWLGEQCSDELKLAAYLEVQGIVDNGMSLD